ncbi:MULTISPECIES: ADP-ribosylglycohydrolase family protein [Streptacidiphilus]|uniref:ADP-ribosylglycohydrolase family protein n=1 Tax=Streptacidiphilus cavernicola TaxID=3342716 RepID=A0ABV6UYI8_9ACTN|nr:ADP-ribosylglycohydrolase family protein [Streptacidiphilus jeojiense]
MHNQNALHPTATITDTAVGDRALGALYGLALGDALGMPTQVMSRAAITSRFGQVTGFEPGPPDNPVAAGLPAASVTDDTEQAVLVGRLLVRGDGHIDPHTLARELLDWEATMKARGSLDLLGPSTKAALDAVARGASVEEAGRTGTTNGAAMRVAPVGIAFPFGSEGRDGDLDGDLDLDGFLDRVVESCQVTHATGIGIAAAAAVAAAVSAGVSGAGLDRCMDAAEQAAAAGSLRGAWVAGADIATRIGWARRLVTGVPRDQAIELIVNLVGTSVASQESIPAAFAVLTLAGADPWQCGLIAANLGGDCDTIGAIACAIAGSVSGHAALPAEAVTALDAVNGIDLRGLSADLLTLRSATHG